MSCLRVSRNQRLVFIGDSNTDTEHLTRFPPYGYGYVMFVATMLAGTHPDLGIDILNRGIDGDTVIDLARRWQKDVIDLAPDWLFVLIGTNDISFRYMPDGPGRAVADEVYVQTLSGLLAETKRRTQARIVLIEPMPFEIPPDYPQEGNRDLERLCGHLARLAEEHDCELVPVRARLAEIMANGWAHGWYQNFNHPAFPGHAFIGQQVLRHLGWQL